MKLIQKFNLRPREEGVFKSPEGFTYKVSVEKFFDHDHQKKPLYYYYPEGLSEHDPEEIVVSFEDDTQSKDHSGPYAGTIEKIFDVFREGYCFACELNEGTVHVEVLEIEEADKGNGPFLSAKNRVATEPLFANLKKTPTDEA